MCRLFSCHLVFDVKMDGTFKARLFKDGHLTEDSEGSRYAGVVSRESERIVLMSWLQIYEMPTCKLQRL